MVEEEVENEGEDALPSYTFPTNKKRAIGKPCQRTRPRATRTVTKSKRVVARTEEEAEIPAVY